VVHDSAMINPDDLRRGTQSHSGAKAGVSDIAMEGRQLSRTTAAYAARLDRTLKGLRERVKEQEAALEQLRASVAPLDTIPSADSKAHLRQLRALSASYRSLTPKEPYLPSPDSPLPALLALRDTSSCIQETLVCIARTEVDIKQAQQRLSKEQADLQDARLMKTALDTRITRLQEDIEGSTRSSPHQRARDMIRALNARIAHYDSETGTLIKAFNTFVDDHLAAMLAIEELGGPVVGDLQDIDETMLETGYNSQGKSKKARSILNEDKRQRRIDQIWGTNPMGNGGEEAWTEKSAAAAEMRELTEQLLNSLVEADGKGPGAYVELQRESAAARFLVRSKVAQFHPKDSRKLRLVDFGGDFSL